MLSNVPLYANCTPTFTISGLTNTITGSPTEMTLMPLFGVLPATLEVNGSSTEGARDAQWFQDSGQLFWSVTDNLAFDPSYVAYDGTTSFTFNFTVNNWHKGRSGSLLTVQASLVDPWTQDITEFLPPTPSAFHTSDFQTNPQVVSSWFHPLHLQTPTISKI